MAPIAIGRALLCISMVPYRAWRMPAAGCSMLHYEESWLHSPLPTDVEHDDKNRYELHVLVVLCLRAGTCTWYNILYDMQYNVFHDGYQNRN